MDHGRHAFRAGRSGWKWVSVLCLVAATGLWPGCSSKKAGDGATPKDEKSVAPAPSGAETAEGVSGKQVTAQSVLETMVAAYKNAKSYADGGQIRLQGQAGGQRIDAKWEFLVAFVRPNKILLHAYEGVVRCDGKQSWAYVRDLSSQVTRRPAPAQVSMESLYGDAILTTALTYGPPQSFSSFPTPLILLLAKDPLKTLLCRAEKTELLPSDKVGDDLCYRVQIARPEGNTVYWVDQKSSLLRRVEYPTEALKQAMGGAQSLSLVADCGMVQIGMDVDPKAFQFEAPPDAKVQEYFAPPDLELFGKPVADFEFTGVDGKPITPKTLAGKTAVLEFWATDCKACPQALPEIEELYRQYKGNDKVAFLAVSTDDAKLENKAIEKQLAEWKVNMPLARDLKNAHAALKVTALPTVLLLSDKGTLLHFQAGMAPGGPVELAAKLRRTLNGEDVARLMTQQYEEATRQFPKVVERWAKADLFIAPPGVQLSTVIPPRSEPASLKMTKLWSCSKLAAPGNILVVEGKDDKPRILVLDAGNAIAELAPDGSVAASTSLKLPPDRLLAALRTGVTADGNRVFVGFNSALPQLYVLDDKLQRTLTFPKDDENPRTTIADVEMARLTADGPLVMLVGYWGVAGVQAVALDGARLWTNKSLDVSRIAVLGPDNKGNRSLLCADWGDRNQSLARVDWQGKPDGKIQIASRHIAWLLCADLTGKGSSEICALAPDEAGSMITVVGLTVDGKEIWSYPLPEGVYDTAVERAVVGNVFADGPSQWFVPAANGSIHILTHDGKLLDRFAYGDRIVGLAVTKLNGQPVLLVATPSVVEAWKIEPLAKR